MKYFDADQEAEFFAVQPSSNPVLAQTPATETLVLSFRSLVTSAVVSTMLVFAVPGTGDAKEPGPSRQTTSMARSRAPPKLTQEQQRISLAAQRFFVAAEEESVGESDPDYGF